jgi:hypothetical protein
MRRHAPNARRATNTISVSAPSDGVPYLDMGLRARPSAARGGKQEQLACYPACNRGGRWIREQAAPVLERQV